MARLPFGKLVPLTTIVGGIATLRINGTVSKRKTSGLIERMIGCWIATKMDCRKYRVRLTF